MLSTAAATACPDVVRTKAYRKPPGRTRWLAYRTAATAIAGSFVSPFQACKRSLMRTSTSPQCLVAPTRQPAPAALHALAEHEIPDCTVADIQRKKFAGSGRYGLLAAQISEQGHRFGGEALDFLKTLFIGADEVEDDVSGARVMGAVSQVSRRRRSFRRRRVPPGVPCGSRGSASPRCA